MKLTRNTTPDGRCKYAIVRLDKLRDLPPQTLIAQSAARALDDLSAYGLLEYGEKGSVEECFVIKLKDVNAAFTLRAYAMMARTKMDDLPFALELFELADRAESHPNQRIPD